MEHISVLSQEVLAVLNPAPGAFVVDGTLGAGGHARLLIKKIQPNGTFLGLDQDEGAIRAFEASADFTDLTSCTVMQNSYSNLQDILRQNQYLGRPDCILLDLGFSSDQIDGALTGRGFSFKEDAPLEMTYAKEATPLWKVLADLSEKELIRILKEYGEERYAVPIAKEIVARKGSVKRTGDLVDAVRSAVPPAYANRRIHPATKTFMALRIYINDELGSLETFLKSIPEITKKGTRVAIISFHSLEDRLVKNYFRDYTKSRKVNKYKKDAAGDESSVLLTKKPITASAEEIISNPRARSATLRALRI